ncbi:MAG: hypothetical protein M3R36_16225 [Bacteroidota bacterium]|nr:hypothetical protein [Bacteroidota bacterium]
MKQLLWLFFFVIILTVSCNNISNKSRTSSNGEDTAKTVENKIQIPVSTCYEGISNQDTIRMKLEVFENVVNGILTYQLHEKDNNKGEFEGQLKGDTLIADYKFMSEGTQSIRQVVFLIKDNVAIEGYGDMEEKNGKMVFKNVKEAVFGKGITLKKEECNY